MVETEPSMRAIFAKSSTTTGSPGFPESLPSKIEAHVPARFWKVPASQEAPLGKGAYDRDHG